MSHSPWNRDPNLEWVLGSNIVEGQSRQKADNAWSYTARDLGEIVVFRDRRVREPIQSPANPLQLSGAVQPEQVFSRNSDAFDIAGPDEWEFARQRQNAIRFGRLLRNVCSNAHLYTLCKNLASKVYRP